MSRKVVTWKIDVAVFIWPVGLQVIRGLVLSVTDMKIIVRGQHIGKFFVNDVIWSYSPQISVLFRPVLFYCSICHCLYFFVFFYAPKVKTNK